MSNRSGASPLQSPDHGRVSMTTSTTTTEKYPASAAHDSHSYPELAPVMTQPPLEHYQQPNPGYNHQQQYNYQNGYPPAGEQTVPQTQKRNPWGLSPLAFGALIAVITAIVVGAAVGGGVAGAMSGNDSSSSSNNTASTVTITATTTTGPTSTDTGSPTSTGVAALLPSSLENYVPAEPYYVSTLANPGCANSNARIEVQDNRTFDLFCGVDMQNHVDDETNPDLQVADVVGIFAYSIVDCLYACANSIRFSDRYNDEFPPCKSVTWNYEMAANNESNSANCWVKNGSSTGYQCNTCISAKLVT